MNKNNICQLNQLFKEFIRHGQLYIQSIGKGDKNLNSEQLAAIKASRELATSKIPNILSQMFDTSKYSCDGSVGQGRVASTPWIAVRFRDMFARNDERVKASIVFFLSTNMNKVFVTLDLRASDFTNSGKKQLASIKKFSDDTLSAIGISSDCFISNDKLDIRNESYKTGAVYSAKWNLDNTEENAKILTTLEEIYCKFHTIQSSENPIMPNYDVVYKDPSTKNSKKNQDIFDINKAKGFINDTQLIYDDVFFKRYVYSLLTRPFVILSGLAGSGKTQLALAFAKAMVEDEKKQMRVVSVGADWTNREPLLGYPNALKEGEYVHPETGVLDLLIDCNHEENKNKPFFLILDEMNLSYVERYFADFLSAMESRQNISLWDADIDNDDIVPSSIGLPKNLFIIGTINVDETTYMFSPKVLDRANVIEFQVSADDMTKFLAESPSVDVESISGKAANMAEDFVNKARTKVEASTEANEILAKFFKVLKKANAEFGYRTATEIGRFLSLSKDDLGIKVATDAAIVQKLLPKLHGSRKKMVDVLKALFEICKNDGQDVSLESITDFDETLFKYPISADKIVRMYNGAITNGYTSFAEA